MGGVDGYDGTKQRVTKETKKCLQRHHERNQYRAVRSASSVSSLSPRVDYNMAIATQVPLSL